MSKCFVFNMGYDISHINSVLAKEGLENGSKIVLITPVDRDERQENSIQDISNYLNSLDFETSMEVFPAGESFQEDMGKFAELFRDLENVILSLSGGPRDFLIPLTVAATAEKKNIQKTYFRSDIDSELRNLNIPDFGVNLNESEEKLLKTLMTGSREVTHIVSNTNLSESTVYRNISKLKKRGLIQEEEKLYSITPMGEILLD